MLIPCICLSCSVYLGKGKLVTGIMCEEAGRVGDVDRFMKKGPPEVVRLAEEVDAGAAAWRMVSLKGLSMTRTWVSENRD
jgi:hypothetical protein